MQQATVFFANGVDADEPDAIASKVLLGEELLKKLPEVRKDCIIMDLSYNTNEPAFLDIVEALIQRYSEVVGLDNFPWSRWYRMGQPNEGWFEELAKETIFLPVKTLIETGRWVLGDQRDEHVLAYRTEIQNGRKVILAAHSQGSINAKEERRQLSLAERNGVDIVAISAFTSPEPNPNAYTTLDVDNLAVGLFAVLGAPPANISLLPNTFPCEDLSPSPWYCHAFKETYMNGENMKDKIVNDIIAALPTAPSGGAISVLVLARETHFPLANTAIQLFAIENLSVPIDEKITDTEGNAFFAHVIPGPQNGFRFCRSGTNRCSGFFGVFEGQTLGITVFF